MFRSIAQTEGLSWRQKMCESCTHGRESKFGVKRSASEKIGGPMTQGTSTFRGGYRWYAQWPLQFPFIFLREIQHLVTLIGNFYHLVLFS